jgi:hypothetical protein
MDGKAAVVSAEANVVEPAQVAEGDDPCLVDTVVANPVVSQRFGGIGAGLDACVEGVQRCVAAEGAMGTMLVVVGPEGVQLRLEDGETPAPACRGTSSGFLPLASVLKSKATSIVMPIAPHRQKLMSSLGGGGGNAGGAPVVGCPCHPAAAPAW